MFLMKKNHLDFKAFVQVLALEKDKLEDYIEVNLLEIVSLHIAVQKNVCDMMNV